MSEENGVKDNPEEKFIIGFDNVVNTKVMHLSIPLERVLREGRFGQVVCMGEIKMFEIELTHVLAQLSAAKKATGIITPQVV